MELQVLKEAGQAGLVDLHRDYVVVGVAGRPFPGCFAGSHPDVEKPRGGATESGVEFGAAQPGAQGPTGERSASAWRLASVIRPRRRVVRTGPPEGWYPGEGSESVMGQ